MYLLKSWERPPKNEDFLELKKKQCIKFSIFFFVNFKGKYVYLYI